MVRRSTGNDCRNDSALGLFNGDIGIALDRGQGTRVWFAMPDGNIKSVQPSRLPEHETTWAMTVHKSQGSEFDHAALILPSQRTPVVTRELVYTAVTRACRRLSLYADERISSAAIATGLSGAVVGGVVQFAGMNVIAGCDARVLRMSHPTIFIAYPKSAINTLDLRW